MLVEPRDESGPSDDRPAESGHALGGAATAAPRAARNLMRSAALRGPGPRRRSPGVGGGGRCGDTPLSAFFGATGTGAQAVGRLDSTHALVVPSATIGRATVAILEAGSGTFVRRPLADVNTGSGFPSRSVVGDEGGGAVVRSAVLVTNDVPVLVRF